MIDAFIIGVIFALIAQYARLNTYQKIVDTVLRKSSDAVQIILFAIAVSSIGFFIMYLLGYATIDVKPFYAAGVAIGGILFGIGVSILGYCPGTIPMAIAEGKIDALFGLMGGIAAGAIYTKIYPYILPAIGPNLGAINLYASDNTITAALIFLYAILLAVLAIRIHKSTLPHGDLK